VGRVVPVGALSMGVGDVLLLSPAEWLSHPHSQSR
jgi:hypothetical protein